LKKRKGIIKFLLSLVLINVLWISTAGVVCAEEVRPAGYHEYAATEDEAIDHWYGIERGAYLRDGICTIKRMGTAKMGISGTTTANAVCDKVKVGIYLNESSDGGVNYGTVGSYYFSKDNASSCYGSKTDISVTSGWYYYTSAGHSVTKGSTTEMMSTNTDAIKAS